MRALHFDCFSGISGDMTLGALLDVGADESVLREGLASLNLPIEVKIAKVRKGGFQATKVDIEAPHEHVHRHLPDVEKILKNGKLTQSQCDLALRIFRRLGEAEAEVHGVPLEKVHFHEVGALDSIADIAGTAIALDSLKVEVITSRSVPTGNGMVQCDHGKMPIPAPATAKLLQGAPLASTTIQGELTTPTGAAILATVVQNWIEQPGMTIEAIGCGSGTRDIKEQPNVLRVFLGTTTGSPEQDQVWVLETNLDDASPEVIGYSFEELLRAGALDVYLTPIHMKKNRPGVILSVIMEESTREAILEVLFRETGTFGIRQSKVERRKLPREMITVQTEWGEVRVKRGWQDNGITILSPEHEDCARIAREKGVALREVRTKAIEACQ